MPQNACVVTLKTYFEKYARQKNTHTHVYIYICIYIGRERERERERERLRERRFNRAERKASVVLLRPFSLALFFRRSNKTPPSGREESALISLSLSPKVKKKKIRRQKFSLARRRRQLRASSSSSSREFQKKGALLFAPRVPTTTTTTTTTTRTRARRRGAGRKERVGDGRTGPASLFSRASLVSSRGVLFNARKSEETAIYPETWRIRTVLNGKRFRRENERKRELGGNLEKKRARWIREQRTHFCAG